MTLTSLPAALEVLLKQLPSSPDSERCALWTAHGRVLSRDYASQVNVPAANNSAMDGYALRAADTPGALPVMHRITAGSDPGELAVGGAARIFTGALMPAGADCVVIQECVTERDGQLTVPDKLAVGANVRSKGADICSGDTVAVAGQRLTPQLIGVFAAVGFSQVEVFRPLRVAVLSTGDELVDPGASAQALKPWQLYNSNRVQLLSQLTMLGYDTLDFGTLPDEPVVIGDALERAAEAADCIICTGGVSVGEADYVRDQIEARGELMLWKLAIKPGKPLAFGRIGSTPIFGLPGNPVSAWATFLLVVKPWLAGAQGALAAPPRRVRAVAAFSTKRPGMREEYLRVRLNGTGQSLSAALTGSQSSGVLTGVARADGLAVVPIGTTIREGEAIDVLLMDSLLSPFTT